MTTHKTPKHGELVSVEATAEILGCSRSHVYRLIAARKLPSLNIAVGTRAKTRIPRANIDQFITSQLTYADPNAKK